MKNQNEFKQQIEQAIQTRFEDVLASLQIKQNAKGAFCCPFHDDSHPSALITHSNRGCCLVCHEGGKRKTFSTIDIVMQVLEANFVEAVDFICQQQQTTATKATKKEEFDILPYLRNMGVNEFRYLEQRHIAFTRTDKVSGIFQSLTRNGLTIRHNYFNGVNRIAYCFKYDAWYEDECAPFVLLKTIERDNELPKAQNFGQVSPKMLWAHGSKSKEIFICEGIEDALTFIQLGRNALTMNGVANLKKTIELVQNLGADYRYIIATDNDEAGLQCEKALLEQLASFELTTYEPLRKHGFALGLKDVNELWVYKQQRA